MRNSEPPIYYLVGTPKSPIEQAGGRADWPPAARKSGRFSISSLHRSQRTDRAFKVLLLGTMVGLRRREIDLLEWTGFRCDEGTIRIEATQHFSAKSEDSYYGRSD
jgi:hypothetical protein